MVVPTPDEARDGIRALTNHVPETMPATHGVLNLFAALRPVAEDDGETSLEKLSQNIETLAATLTVCVITLENRLEQLAGRPGLPESTLDAIMGEFGVGG
ncbi:hypothetical protein HMPREF0591_4843 [Mycobacterium parascrofulaceum ATCC BAA-614]|uniref:Uncharacterized protein n=1 Tax=Mycobacterium parascrofulaceum ATCC BAA-614 TaxID=525368 RepID=D5PF99_9MYCO|nr:hypothetical protein [Mycobacterium parascrofulaceum]EFG75280.1 hypothetical protein HMPREF0591_4843 [Mycobacterium parascrofulaceum ATCC BAA-614]